MFGNPGSKLKKWAIFLYIVIIIASLILAIVFRNGVNASPYADFDPLTFFGFFLLGPILGYLACLILYGFGEIVENSGKSNGTKEKEEIEAEKERKELERINNLP